MSALDWHAPQHFGQTEIYRSKGGNYTIYASPSGCRLVWVDNSQGWENPKPMEKTYGRLTDAK